MEQEEIDKQLAKEERIERLEGSLINLVSTLAGAGLGTIDVLTSGFPLLTAYAYATSIAKVVQSKKMGFLDFLDEDNIWKKYSKGLFFNALGVSIPFIIKYHQEIADFIQNYILR